MTDIDVMIMRDIEDDVSIRVKGLAVEITKKGFLSRRKTLVIRGTVENQHDRDKIASIANHHAGDSFEIDNLVAVRTPAEA